MKRNHKYFVVALLPLLLAPACIAAAPYVFTFSLNSALPVAVTASEFVVEATTPMPSDDEMFNSLLANRNYLETLVRMYSYDLDIESIQIPGPVPPHCKLSLIDRKRSTGESADTIGYYPEYDMMFKACKLRHGMTKGENGNYLLFPVYSVPERGLDGTIRQRIEKGFAYAQGPVEKEVMTLQGETPGAIKFRSVRGPWYLYLRAGKDLGDSLKDFR